MYAGHSRPPNSKCDRGCLHPCSDEEMDMVDFLKHIPPKSISSGTSTRTPIGPPGDEEIDIYQFLHTSEPPQIPSSVVSSRMLASDTGKPHYSTHVHTHIDKSTHLAHSQKQNRCLRVLSLKMRQMKWICLSFCALQNLSAAITTTATIINT